MGLLRFEFKVAQDILSRITLVRRVNLYFKQAAKITRRTVAVFISDRSFGSKRYGIGLPPHKLVRA